MALITGSANVSIDPVTGKDHFVGSWAAGAAIKNCAFVYMASDGDVEEALTTSGAVTIGVSFRDAKRAGEITDIFGPGTRIGRYSSGMTPGTVLYLSDTDPGSLEDAATVADTKGVAVVISATDILVTRADGQNRGEGY